MIQPECPEPIAALLQGGPDERWWEIQPRPGEAHKGAKSRDALGPLDRYRGKQSD